MLNHREIEDIMKEYELYYTKKSIIETILPRDIFKFEKKDFKVLCNQVKIV